MNITNNTQYNIIEESNNKFIITIDGEEYSIYAPNIEVAKRRAETKYRTYIKRMNNGK